MTRLARRWIGTHGRARSAATRCGRVHRPAWPFAPPRARELGIDRLNDAAAPIWAVAFGPGEGYEDEQVGGADLEQEGARVVGEGADEGRGEGAEQAGAHRRHVAQ